LRLAKNRFAGPANQCYKATIAELDFTRPAEMAAAGFSLWAAAPGLTDLRETRSLRLQSAASIGST